MMLKRDQSFLGDWFVELRMEAIRYLMLSPLLDLLPEMA